MAKKREAVDQAFEDIIGASVEEGAKPERPNPISVLLDADELASLGKAADALGVSRHALLQHIVRQFLADWSKGKRPKVGTKKIITLEID